MRTVISAIATIAFVDLGLSACGEAAREGDHKNVPFQNELRDAASEGQTMSGKVRPWDRKDVKVYWPEPITTIEYEPKERKAVDTATGEFIIMRPGSHGGPGQFLFGDSTDDWVVSGGYTSGWFPDEHVQVFFLNALSLRSNLQKSLSRSEYDASPIARMMAASRRAADAVDPKLAPLRNQSPEHKMVVIDARPGPLL